MDRVEGIEILTVGMSQEVTIDGITDVVRDTGITLSDIAKKHLSILI